MQLTDPITFKWIHNGGVVDEACLDLFSCLVIWDFDSWR